VRFPAVATAGRRVLIGPANYAGQAHAWARALEAHAPDVAAVSFTVTEEWGFGFPTDYAVPRAEFFASIEAQREHFDWVAATFTHVVIEACRPLFGALFQRDSFAEAGALRGAGIDVAMMAHGTEVRVPSRHAAREPYSPFATPYEGMNVLERRARRNVARLGAFPGPIFFSTPDLAQDVPRGTWCPLVVDLDAWAADGAIMERDIPRVVHVPSNGRIKGSDLLAQPMADLVRAGVLDYQEITGIPAGQVPAVVRGADIVADQFRLGSYGAMAAEAMASGRVAVGHISQPVRRFVAEATGLELPIYEVDPGGVEGAMRALVEGRQAAADLARLGHGFARVVHGGAASAKALEGFL
jgi:hypothetical protein